jgi:TolB-like protein/DNA-binding winged helix-turn-helix (wHTH) protein/Tfp pilus assembly protein PilF
VAQVEPRRYRFDGFTVDLARACLLRAGDEVSVRPRAFDALRYFVENHGRLVTKDELIRTLWPRTVVTDDSLTKCIQDVRNALQDDGHRYLKTVHRRGYIFDAAIVVERGGAAASDAIEPAAHAASPTAAAPVAAPARMPLIRRRTLAAALAGAVAATALASLAWYWLSSGDSAVMPRSVAVLPLENLSTNPDDEFFSAGIHEAILNQLAQIDGLKTISRTAMLRYARTRKPVRDIARELNVQTVMEGSVRYAEGRVRVTAQLIDPATDTHLWSEEYDRPLADIFAIQTDIAQRIAAALDVRLSAAERTRLADHPTRSPEAYELYLRGRYHWDKWTREEARRSIEYFEEAIRHDPSYALAHAGLADAYTALQGLGAAPPDELMPTAKAAVSRALELDPELPEAYIARGLIRYFYDWDYAGGNADFERAIALDARSATAHHLYGKNLPVTREFDKAFAELERALDLERYSTGINKDIGETLFYARRYDEALAQFERTLELEPGSLPVQFWLVRCYEAKGMRDEAVEAQLGLLVTARASGRVAFSAGDADSLRASYRSSGWESFWRANLADLEEAAARDAYVEPWRFVEIHLRLGDHDAAFAALETAFQRRSAWIPTIHIDPLLDPVRSDPRLAELMKRADLR